MRDTVKGQCGAVFLAFTLSTWLVRAGAEGLWLLERLWEAGAL